ncbi:Hydroxypyruvate isomerase [hydrothermal vent metagenome]|uniref:Hydroxypyruvate isomerase n=1 Tax=hydrothermal vent metagenome TaxID=652676 RepID=A0A3B1DER5_9ZZZZ
MNRRDFLATSAIAATVTSTLNAKEKATGKHKFQLKYAPHFNMFRHHAGKDLIDQLKFMADEGFAGLEDNGMLKRSKETQSKIAKEMQRLGMTMGVFVATKHFSKPTFASGEKKYRDQFLADIKQSVEVAKRVNAKWITVVPGTYDHKKELDYQTANVIEGLKYCAEICEKSNLVMVLEPLNHFTNHPDLFLWKVPQAYLICKAVNSPSCKILFDIYHQQISEGNIIPNIDMAWSEVAYFQIGDNPGRKEPTTGEINYRNIFKHIHAKGFTGIMGMEHGNSQRGKEGERAVIDAYIQSDTF